MGNSGQGTLTSKYPDRQHFRVVQGLCGVDGTVSFESVAMPGNFLNVIKSKLIYVDPNRQNLDYKKDACFYPRYNKYFEGYTAYESVSWPRTFIRHRNFMIGVSPDDNSDFFKNDASWKTNVPEVQQVSTYEDAVFESMKYPDSKLGVNGNRGVLTTKQKFQHFRVIPGRCGVAGTISFESVALPGRFLYIYNNLIYFAGYKDIQRMKLHYKVSTCFYPRYNKYFEGYTAYESFLSPNFFIRLGNDKLAQLIEKLFTCFFLQIADLPWMHTSHLCEKTYFQTVFVIKIYIRFIKFIYVILNCYYYCTYNK